MDNDDILVFSEEKEDEQPNDNVQPPWRILLVDDEPSIHHVTLLALRGVTFDGRELEFLHCYSGEETKLFMQEETDIALIFLDVVMETENAGLEITRYIRETLKNNQVRIILRTGQPGSSPETEIIKNYDINDYKTKTELTSSKLETSVISALRAYKELNKSELLRMALDKILLCTSCLSTHSSLQSFYHELLTCLTGVLPLAQQFSPVPLLSIVEITQKTFNVKQSSTPIDNAYAVERAQIFSTLINDLGINGIVPKTVNGFKNQHALLYLDKSENGVLTYLALSYDKEIEEEESKLLVNLCQNIEMVANNVRLSEKLLKTSAQSQVFSDHSVSHSDDNDTKKNELQNAMLFSKNHEIRTCMNAILGFAHIMARSESISDWQSTIVNKIVDSGRHLVEIIDGILVPTEPEQTVLPHKYNTTPVNITAVDFKLITLDKMLIDELIILAKMNSTTRIKKRLAEFLTLEPEMKDHIDYLNRFVDSFDMGGLINVLEDVNHER